MLVYNHFLSSTHYDNPQNVPLKNAMVKKPHTLSVDMVPSLGLRQM